MIDPTKPVMTKDGKRVLGLTRVPFNSCGRLVTFPLKGSVVMREKPLRLQYMIWTDEGKTDVLPVSALRRDRSNLDLIQVQGDAQ